MGLVHRFGVTSVSGRITRPQPFAAIAFAALVMASMPARTASRRRVHRQSHSL